MALQLRLAGALVVAVQLAVPAAGPALAGVSPASAIWKRGESGADRMHAAPDSAVPAFLPPAVRVPQPLLLAQAGRPAQSAPASEPATPARTPQGSDGPAADESEKKKEPAGKGDQEKKAEASGSPDVVKRPGQPEEAPDPKELQMQPDARGRVRFNIGGQPWPGILKWLADVSELSLDWQELPSDYLNLRTRRDYTIPEAQDLINRHLLSRGFTILVSGEMMTVINVAKINPALVPRLDPDELEERPDHEFVKVSLPLRWMLAEQAVEELKPMLSPNGTLTALKGVNRIEAMDAAVNLRDIHRLLQLEQSDEASKRSLVREFRLQHRRAVEVALMLEAMLGLERDQPAAASGSGDMAAQQMMRQMQQQMQQMQQSRGGPATTASPAKEDEPKLVVNERENSILAHASPDKMEIIQQTVEAVDVPGDDASQLIHHMSRIKSYRLSTLDPQPLIGILKEMGNLSPQSRIQTDEKNGAIILYGTLADHYTVQSLVDRLDSSHRKFEVIRLRRVRADAVAATIQYMLGAEDEDKSKNNSLSSRYVYYGYGQPQRSEDKENRPFRVDADVENNRLLVWANDVELEEVRNLLVKMGEVALGGSHPETLRAFDLYSDEEADHLLRRLKELWPELEPNQLLIRPAPPREEADEPQERTPSISRAPEPARNSPRNAQPFTPNEADVSTRAAGPDAVPLRLALREPLEGTGRASSWTGPASPLEELEEDRDARPNVTEEEFLRGFRRPSRGQPPITIERGPNGRILFGSPDTQALDRLEDLLIQLAPPPQDYRVFRLKHPNTWAYGIKLILEDFFQDSSDQQTHFDPFWGTSYTTKAAGNRRLSHRREMKIISDEDSRTLLVHGATPEQLQIIGDLIEIYDRPNSDDPQAIRRTEIFRLEYSQATMIAETVKQVYRDLLSANDPALQSPHANGQQKPEPQTSFTYVYGRGQQEAGSKDQEPQQPIKFKGLLSVGVDELSNTVVVSAADGLMADVRELIQELDDAARPDTTVRVLQVQGMNSNGLKERLSPVFAPSFPNVKTSETRTRRGDHADLQPPANGSPAPAGRGEQ